MDTITLNKEQRQAVNHGKVDQSTNFISSPLLIIAGAGTGKTNTLAHRAAHLLLNKVDPERILLMTFSRRAAIELSDRTKRIINQAQKSNSKPLMNIHMPWMGTFHSIANRLLRHYGSSMGIDPNFTIIDRNDAADFIDLLRHELTFSTKDKRFPKKSTCLNIYSRCVNSQLKISQVLKQDYPWCEEWQDELSSLFKLYAERKLEQLTLDYDDLLLYWYFLVEPPEIAELIRKKFDHILVDEYQDTNLLQAGILSRLFPDGQGLTVVGDDAQSIYGFRSAEIENIINFPYQFNPPAEIIALKTNYRSTQPILDLANELLAQSKIGYNKTLISHQKKQHGKTFEKPKIITVEDDTQQAKYIVETLLAERENGVALNQQAILFRSSHHSDRLEVELIRHDIPFVKFGGLKFLEAAHVKDLLAIIKWIDNPKHQISAFRVLKLLPGVGPSIAKKANEFLRLNQYQFEKLEYFSVPACAQRHWSKLVKTLVDAQSQTSQWPNEMELVNQFYRPLLEETYDDAYVRIGDIEQLTNIAQQFISREKFISELTLEPPIATGDLNNEAHKDDDFVILSTIHSAKGQEWKNVFVLNVADGNFPNEYATDSPKAIEEERRLLNVAITRAKQSLHLIQPLKYWVPEQKKYGNKHVYGAKSRFLTNQVSQRLEHCFYPHNQVNVAEPHAKYAVINDIHSKIKQLW
jgi:DNA helicase II / ATP-dependent DNA helicase PcrA